MLNFRYGPDGSVLRRSTGTTRTSATAATPTIHQKTLGRIFKISHDNDKWVAGRSAEAVVGAAGRAAAAIATTGTCGTRGASCRSAVPTRRCTPRLKRILRDNPDVTRKLRALWALHVTDGLTEQDLLELLGHDSEYLRSWAVYLLVDGKNAVGRGAARSFARMARAGPVAARAALPRERAAARAGREALGRRWRHSSRTPRTRRITTCR